MDSQSRQELFRTMIESCTRMIDILQEEIDASESSTVALPATDGLLSSTTQIEEPYNIDDDPAIHGTSPPPIDASDSTNVVLTPVDVIFPSTEQMSEISEQNLMVHAVNPMDVFIIEVIVDTESFSSSNYKGKNFPSTKSINSRSIMDDDFVERHVTVENSRRRCLSHARLNNPMPSPPPKPPDRSGQQKHVEFQVMWEPTMPPPPPEPPDANHGIVDTIVFPPFMAIAVHPRQGVWEIIPVNVFDLNVELLSVFAYFGFTEELVEGGINDNFVSELDFTAFSAPFLCPKRSSSISNGVKFLNRHLSSGMFSNRDSWEHLLKFLYAHTYKGYALLLNDRIQHIPNFQSAVIKAEDHHSHKFAHDTPYSEFELVGMGSDLFNSYAESSSAALIIALIFPFGINHDFTAMLYPLLVNSRGILLCLITTLFASYICEIKFVTEIEPPLFGIRKLCLELVMCLHVTIALCGSLGQYNRAIPILENLVEISPSREGQQLGLAKIAGHMQLGDTYAMLGQFKNSITCYAAEFEDNRQVLGKSDPRIGKTCRYVTKDSFQALQFDNAKRQCPMTLDSYQANSSASSLEEATDRRLMGLIGETKENSEAALEYYFLASMEIIAYGHEVDVILVDCSIRDTHSSLYQYVGAIFAYQKSYNTLKNLILKLCAICEKKSSFIVIALTQIGLTSVQHYAFNEEKIILDKELGPYYPDTLVVYSTLVGAYDADGSLDNTLQMLKQDVHMWEDKLWTANPDVGEDWKDWKNSYNLEDKVVFNGGCNVMTQNGTWGNTPGITESVEANGQGSIGRGKIN